MLSRDQIRKEIRARRRALSPQERSIRAAAIASHLLRSRLFRTARAVAGYLPVRGEADPTPVLRQARRHGKDVYLPVLARLGHAGLCFARFDDGVRLRPNRFGILEPEHHPRDLVRGLSLDLVLTPLVAFDAHGNRLGMGGGFYDRTFSYLAHRTHWCRPVLIGYAYSFQEVDGLPRQRWDVPLSGVATEHGLTLFR